MRQESGWARDGTQVDINERRGMTLDMGEERTECWAKPGSSPLYLAVIHSWSSVSRGLNSSALAQEWELHNIILQSSEIKEFWDDS